MGRIETRLKDIDSGACDAAERFIALVHIAQEGGSFPPYMRSERAVQRTAVEAGGRSPVCVRHAVSLPATRSGDLILAQLGADHEPGFDALVRSEIGP